MEAFPADMGGDTRVARGKSKENPHVLVCVSFLTDYTLALFGLATVLMTKKWDRGHHHENSDRGLNDLRRLGLSAS